MPIMIWMARMTKETKNRGITILATHIVQWALLDICPLSVIHTPEFGKHVQLTPGEINGPNGTEQYQTRDCVG